MCAICDHVRNGPYARPIDARPIDVTYPDWRWYRA